MVSNNEWSRSVSLFLSLSLSLSLPFCDIYIQENMLALLFRSSYATYYNLTFLTQKTVDSFPATRCVICVLSHALFRHPCYCQMSWFKIKGK